MDSLPLDYGVIRLDPVAEAISLGQYGRITHDSERKLVSSDAERCHWISTDTLFFTYSWFLLGYWRRNFTDSPVNGTSMNNYNYFNNDITLLGRRKDCSREKKHSSVTWVPKTAHHVTINCLEWIFAMEIQRFVWSSNVFVLQWRLVCTVLHSSQDLRISPSKLQLVVL